MIDSFQTSLRQDSTSGTIVLGRLIGSSLVESFTNSYTLTDPNGNYYGTLIIQRSRYSCWIIIIVTIYTVTKPQMYM